MSTKTTVLILIFFADIATGFEGTTYTRNLGMSGVTPVVQSSITVRSATECAGLCSLSNSCRGFYHSESVQECFLDTSDIFDSFKNDSLAKYYEKIEYQTFPEAYATFSSTTCPSTLTEDIILQGPTGMHYAYKFLIVSVFQDDALNLCADLNMQLVQLDDDNKAEDLIAFLQSCQVYHGAGYWTDIRRQEDDGQWTTSDGHAVSSSVWCNGPGTNPGEPCARLNNGCDFRLNDMPCNNGYNRFRAICE